MEAFHLLITLIGRFNILAQLKLREQAAMEELQLAFGPSAFSDPFDDDTKENSCWNANRGAIVQTMGTAKSSNLILHLLASTSEPHALG